MITTVDVIQCYSLYPNNTKVVQVFQQKQIFVTTGEHRHRNRERNFEKASGSYAIPNRSALSHALISPQAVIATEARTRVVTIGRNLHSRRCPSFDWNHLLLGEPLSPGSGMTTRFQSTRVSQLEHGEQRRGGLSRAEERIPAGHRGY